MRLFLSGLALASLLTGAAQAEPNIRAKQTSEARTTRVLYVCDSADRTQRAFAREFGSGSFVTAADVLGSGANLSAPRCISKDEARRLKVLKTQQLQVATAR